MKPTTPFLTALAFGALLLTGCATRSISNSNYDAAYGRAGAKLGGYVGELSALDVVGLKLDAGVTEADITAAIRGRSPAQLSPLSRILLIQSGAEYPDEPMVAALRGRFEVAGFSGKPASIHASGPDFARALRLVAARGGYDKIVCYWGVLESERRNKFTSAVSWVPIVGHAIPDEREHMRLRLKAAIVDVTSGNWTLVTPAAVSDSSLSSIANRRAVDQELVEGLKAQGYRDLAQLLTERHSE